MFFVQVKAAFTRAYNKNSAPAPYASVPFKKGSKGDLDGMDIDDEEDVEDDEEEDLEVDSMIMVTMN